MTPEQPPRGEHQANGLAEVTGRHVRDHARVLRLHLQDRIKPKMAQDEPVMPWLLRWAAMSFSRFSKGKDGKTPYGRQRGRTCEMDVVPFGEIVMYRIQEVACDRHQALEERLAKGVWMGHAFHSSEVLIAAEKGIIKTWAIRGLPNGQQEDGKRIRNIKGSPTNWKVDASEES